MWCNKQGGEGSNSFLGLLAMVILMQPRMLLAVFASGEYRCLMFSLLSTKIPGSPFAELLSSCSVLSLYCCKGFFFVPGVGLRICLSRIS